MGSDAGDVTRQLLSSCSQERLLCFATTHDLTSAGFAAGPAAGLVAGPAAGLAAQFLRILADTGVDPTNMVGQGYNGAATMVPLQWCRYNGAATMVPLQWCRYNGAATMVPLQRCRYNGAATMVPLQWCRYNGAATMVPLSCPGRIMAFRNTPETPSILPHMCTARHMS